MKTFYQTYSIGLDGEKNSFHTIELKNKQRNGKTFVLFNSRWHLVKYWETIVDGLPRYRRNYIGPISTYLQNEIRIESGPITVKVNA